MFLNIRQVENTKDAEDVKKKMREGAPKGEKEILNFISTLVFRQVPVWVGMVGDEPVTVNGTYFEKRKRDVWGPYANAYTAFTRIDLRRKGYARELNNYVREKAVEAGCMRWKALTGSRLGIYFHQAFGDQFWCLNDRQMMVVDTPLVDASRFPLDQTPASASRWTTRTTPLTPEELEVLLREPLYYEQ